MNRHEILQHLDNAKRVHITWRMNALKLLSGLPDQDKAPIHHEECQFSRWYKGEGLKACGHFDSYHQLDSIHQEVHEAYQAIWESVRSNQHSLTLQNLDKLTDISDRLISGIDKLSSDIQADC